MSSKCKSLDAHILDVALTTSETEIAHNLGRQPQDGWVLQTVAAVDVFRGPTVWDSENIYLTSSANVVIRLLIF